MPHCDAEEEAQVAHALGTIRPPASWSGGRAALLRVAGPAQLATAGYERFWFRSHFAVSVRWMCSASSFVRLAARSVPTNAGPFRSRSKTIQPLHPCRTRNLGAEGASLLIWYCRYFFQLEKNTLGADKFWP